jgi:predicted transcriptional regulator
LQAVFSYWPVDPVFTLQGRTVNGMSGTEAKAILRSLASDVQHTYGTIESRAAGIRATKWEAGDEPIMSVTVQPPDPADA